jgi:hypothetical protein
LWVFSSNKIDMKEILQKLKNMVYGYESDFNGKIISKGEVIENDGRKNDKTEKRD